MPNWYDITRDPEYQSLPEVDRLDLKKTFFNETIGKDPEFSALDDVTKQATWMEFMQSPDDTGQGVITSTLGGAARGFGEVVPGAIQGLGALTGISPLETAGEAVRSGLEYITPVNPLYQESIPVKAAGVVGQVGSVLATAGAGGLAGKALAAERLASGATAAEQALAASQAISRGANAALYGSAGLQGAAQGAQTADQYGLTGANRYGNILAGAATEIGTEMLPFGLGAETAAAKRILGVTPRAGRFAGDVASEAGEEFTGQVAQNAALAALAPTGTETPELMEGALEAGAYGGLGGGILGGVNLASGAYKKPVTLPESIPAPVQEAVAQAEESVIAASDVAPQTAQVIAELNAAMQRSAPSGQETPSEVEQRLSAIQNEPIATAPAGTSVSEIGTTENLEAGDGGILGIGDDGRTVPPQAQFNEAEPPPSKAVVGAPEVGAARNEEVIRQAAARLAGTEQGPNLNFPQTQPPQTYAPEIPSPAPLPLGKAAESSGRVREENTEGQEVAGKGEGEEVAPIFVGQTVSEEGQPVSFNVDDQLLMRSPFTNEDSSVSFRGVMPDGDAVVWTGKTQMKVPSAWLRRAGEPLPISANKVGDVPISVIDQESQPDSSVTVTADRQQTLPIPKTKDGLIAELVGPIKADYVARQAQQKTITSLKKRSKDELSEMVKDQRKSDAEFKRRQATTLEIIEKIKEPVNNAGTGWVRLIKQIAEANGIDGHSILQGNSRGDEIYRIAARIADRGNAFVNPFTKPLTPPTETPTSIATEGQTKPMSGDSGSVGERLNAAKSREEAREILNGVKNLPTLKDLAKEMGYPTTGTKKDVVNRLVAAAGSRFDAAAIRETGKVEEKAPEKQAPSEKVEAGNAAFDNIISELPVGAQAKYTPEVRAKAAKFFETRNESDLNGLTTIQKTKVHEALYRSDKEAEAAQKAADKLYEKKLREEEKENARLEKERAEQEKLTESRREDLTSIIGTPQGVEMNAVSPVDGQESLALVHNSGDVPGVLNAFVGTSKEFLANPQNEKDFPELFAILKNGRVDEGNFAYGRAFVFTDGIGVNAIDRANAKELGITPSVAAVRRVLIHESLVHRGIYGLPARLQMQILQWVRQNASPQDLDALAKSYPQYADWATNPQQMLGLCEEFLAKKIEKMTKFPTSGPLARLVEILKDIWRYVTGSTAEPTVKNLRDIVKLLKAGAKAADQRLVNGGGIKMSQLRAQGFVTPEMDKAYMDAVEVGDMDKAQRMVDDAASGSVYNERLYHGGAATNEFYPFTFWSSKKDVAQSYTTGRSAGGGSKNAVVTDAFVRIENPLNFSAELVGSSPAWFTSREVLKEAGISESLIETLNDTYSDDQPVGVPDLFDKNWGSYADEILSELKALGYDSISITEDGAQAFVVFSPSQIKSADPVTRDDAGNVIPLSQRFNPEKADIRESRISYTNPLEAQLASASERMRQMREKQGAQENAEPSPGGLSEAEVLQGGTFTLYHRGPVGFHFEAPMFFAAQDIGRSYGAELKKASVTIRNPARDSDIIKAATIVGIRKRGLKAYEYLSPNLMDSPFTPRDVERLIIELEEQGFDGAVVKDYDVPFSVIPFATSQIREVNPESSRAAGGTTPQQIRNEIRKAYNAAIQGQGSVQAPLQQVYDLVKKQIPTLTEKKFGEQVQALYEDGGAFLVPTDRSADMLAAGEKWGVYDVAGLPASYIGVMPTEIKASVVPKNITDKQRTEFQKNKITGDTVEYQGYPLTNSQGEVIEHWRTEQQYKPKKQVAEEFVQQIADGLDDITQLPDEVLNDEYLRSIGAEYDGDFQTLLTAQSVVLLRSKAKEATDPEEKQRLEQAADKGTAFLRQGASQAGSDLKMIQQIQKDPRFAGMFAVDSIKTMKKEDQAAVVDPNFTNGAAGVEGLNNQANTQASDDLERDINRSWLERAESLLPEKAQMLLKKIREWLGENAKALERIELIKAFIAKKTGGIKQSVARNAAESTRYESMTVAQAQAEIAKEQKGINDNNKKIVDALEKVGDILFSTGQADSPQSGANIADKIAKLPRKEKLLKAGKMTELQRLLDKTRDGWSWKQIFTMPQAGQARRRADMLQKVKENEAFKALNDDEKQHLVELLDQAWYDRKATYLAAKLKSNPMVRLPFTTNRNAAKKLEESTPELLKAFNDGTFNKEIFNAILAKKYGVKPIDKAAMDRAEKLAEELQDSELPDPVYAKKADELLKLIADTQDLNKAKILNDFWVTSVLAGPRTWFDIGLAALNGLQRILVDSTNLALHGDFKTAGTALSRFVGIMPQAFKEAVHFIKNSDVSILVNSKDQFARFLGRGLKGGQHTSTSYQLANWNQDKESGAPAWKKTQGTILRTVGRFMQVVERLLTALDHINATATKYGYMPIAIAQNQRKYTQARLPNAVEMNQFRTQAKGHLLGGREPTTADEKTLLEAWTRHISDKFYSEWQDVVDGASYAGAVSSGVLDPEGLVGAIYNNILAAASRATSAADSAKVAAKAAMKNTTIPRFDAYTKYALSTMGQIAAYSARNLLGFRFIRFGAVKFNDSLTYIPVIGLLRLNEADNKHATKQQMIWNNQAFGVVLTILGTLAIQLLAEEDDPEKRGFDITGSLDGLTAAEKKQISDSGQKEYTLTIYRNGKPIRLVYKTWPISAALSAIGTLADMVKYKRDKWDEKQFTDRLVAAVVVATTSTLDSASMSQFAELIGKGQYADDPDEAFVKKITRVTTNFAGGFVPRVFKDLDFWLLDPNARKYETVWQNLGKELPIWRQHIGSPKLDIFANPVQTPRSPWSRAIVQQPEDEAYNTLGLLNSRDLWLVPGNPELRTVGTKNHRRGLTPEEQNRYIKLVGDGYKQIVEKYGQRILQMPKERAKAFLADKSKDVRDAAEKKAIRRLTPSSS